MEHWYPFVPSTPFVEFMGVSLHKRTLRMAQNKAQWNHKREDAGHLEQGLLRIFTDWKLRQSGTIQVRGSQCKLVHRNFLLD